MRFRPSTIASSLLWAFVYGAALECLRVLVAEKLPKLHQLDQLEGENERLNKQLGDAIGVCDELRAERAALKALNAQARGALSGLYLGTVPSMKDVLFTALDHAAMAVVPSTRADLAERLAVALSRRGWVLFGGTQHGELNRKGVDVQ